MYKLEQIDRVSKGLRYMCFQIMMINILEELKDKFDNFGISY